MPEQRFEDRGGGGGGGGTAGLSKQAREQAEREAKLREELNKRKPQETEPGKSED
jgi:hypothetical protein